MAALSSSGIGALVGVGLALALARAVMPVHRLKQCVSGILGAIGTVVLRGQAVLSEESNRIECSSSGTALLACIQLCGSAAVALALCAFAFGIAAIVLSLMGTAVALPAAFLTGDILLRIMLLIFSVNAVIPAALTVSASLLLAGVTVGATAALLVAGAAARAASAVLQSALSLAALAVQLLCALLLVPTLGRLDMPQEQRRCR
jgi:hypothetical protein